MKVYIKYFCLFIFCFFSTSFTIEKDNTSLIDSEELLNKILDKISKLKTLRYELKCKERMKGRMQFTESKVKLQISPRKLYISVNGPEVLWIENQNNGNAYVNPGSFPFINLNLDPYGQLMRGDQHHTIHEMGFHYLADILQDGKKKAGDEFDKHFKVVGEEVYNGKSCYKLTIMFPEYTWVNYTVLKGENLTTIGRKLKVCEYMILERNTKIKWYDEVKTGQVIKVPTTYSKLTHLLIDKETFLPISNKIYDDLGLFESYDYYNMKIDTPIFPEEFTKSYKDYNF